MDRPIRFKTRRGNTVFRQSYRNAGETKYSENYGYRIKRDGRQYFFSLGADKKRAATMADEIGTFLAVKSHTLEEALQAFCPAKATSAKKGENHVPTVKEFCDRYREAAIHLSETTMQNNICAIRRIAAHILGFSVNGKSMPRQRLKIWRAKVDGMSLSRITPEQLLSFRSSLIRRAGQDQIARGRAITTGNSYLRCAGSMFIRKWRLSYQDFILPDPNPFPEIDRLPEPPHRYHSTFDAGLLVTAAETELRDADPEAYVVFTLAFFCGMRRKEIDRLRWDKVDSEHGHVWVSMTSDSRPKSWKSDAPVDAAKNVFEVLAAYRHRSVTPPYVIAALSRNKRYRCGPIFKRLILWLKGKGVREFRTLHALRAEAGSIIYQQTDSTDVAADFLRNDPRVAREHYIGRKGRLELVLPKATELSSATAA